MATVIDPNLHSMQVTVPHSEYGYCEYFMPHILATWLYSHGIVNFSMCGGGSWGDGFTNGVTNKTTDYMVRNITPEDAVVFKIQFPKCKIYVCEQYLYV